MRITKLHLLFILLLAGIGLLGFYFWQVKQEEMRQADERVASELGARRKTDEESLKKIPEAPKPAPLAAPAVSEVKKSTESLTYQVKNGDTLWNIAKMKMHFGLGHRWFDIWKANERSVSDFDRISAGQVLKIPIEKPENYPWPKTSEERKKKLLKEETGPSRQVPSN